jgi:hypothetical protein
MPARVGWGRLAHGLLLSSFSASALGSDLAWNIAGLLGYQWRFKKHDFDLALGIRALSIG